MYSYVSYRTGGAGAHGAAANGIEQREKPSGPPSVSLVFIVFHFIVFYSPENLKGL